jgi:hypothetical protein
MLAAAFNCKELSAVPYAMEAGVAQLMVGCALLTTRLTVAVTAPYLVLSVGVKVTFSGWIPACKMIPAAGE